MSCQVSELRKCKPPEKLTDNRFMQMWASSVKKLKILTEEEINVSANRLADLRDRSAKNRPPGVYMAFWGFAEPLARNTILRGIRYALRPRLIFCSSKRDEIQGHSSNTYFEGVVLYQRNLATIEEIEEIFDMFHMSIGVTDLDHFMSEAMVTCITRIEMGRYHYGNWRIEQNVYYREEHRRCCRQREDREARANLLVVTGMELNPSNMIRLFHNANNIEIDLQQHLNQSQLVQRIGEQLINNLARVIQISLGREGNENRALLTSSLNSQLLQHRAFNDQLAFLSMDPRPPPGPVAISGIEYGPRNLSETEDMQDYDNAPNAPIPLNSLNLRMDLVPVWTEGSRVVTQILSRSSQNEVVDLT